MRTVLALFLASLCYAQQSGRVEGRVVTPTGAPVPKATVRLVAPASVPGQQSASYVEITSSDGRFVAEGVAPGRYNVNAQRTGYAPMRTSTGGVTPVTVELAAGATKSGVEVRLTPLAIISGMVTDADGDPVPGAQVRLMKYSFSSRLTLTNSSAGNSDDRGMFRLSGVQPGRYYLSALPPGTPANQNEIRGRSAQELNLPTFYPNAADVRGAVALSVDSAEISNLNIRMLRGGLYSIKGNFVGPNGASISSQISVFSKGGEQPPGMNMQTRDPGMFQLSNMPPGEYTLVARSTPARVVQNPAPAATVRAADPPLVQFSGRVDVTLGSSNLENVTIRLTEGAEITGRITIEGGLDLEKFMASGPGGQVVQGQPQRRMPSVMVNAIEGPNAQIMATANADGTFRLANVPPLKRALQINPLPPNAYIKAVRFGGQDVTRAPLDLSSGSGGALEILIGTKGGEVTATPRDEKGETPQGGAPVTIWPRTPNLGSPSGDVRVLPAAGGVANAKAQGLAPGEYYVAAWETTTTDYLRVPEFLARFVSLATRVSIAEGESISVEPKIIPRQAIEREVAQFP